MSEQNGQPPVEAGRPAALPDPTQDRTILLARVGEAQMRLEAMAAHYEAAVAEAVELRGRVAVLEAQLAESTDTAGERELAG